MQDFWTHIPTKIIFGRNKIEQIGEVTRTLGIKTLFVFGYESIQKRGIYQLVREKLNDMNVEVFDHGGVKPNPVISHVREGVKKAKSNQVDSILAVGGGSVIDEAKAIAMGAVVEDDVWDFFAIGKKPSKALAVIAVSTLAATGSEMNGSTVITNEETKEKIPISSPCLYPKISILDPLLTCSVSANLTAYGIVDAFSHVLEPYFNARDNNTPVQDRIAEALFLSLFEISKRLFNNLYDYNARADMMWTACMANNFLIHPGLGTIRYENHLIAHSLGAIFDIEHGAALSVIIPGWMKYTCLQKLRKFSQFASRVMGINDGLSEQEKANQGILKLKDWFASMGSPVSLKQLGITERDIHTIITSVIPLAAKSKMEDINRNVLREILNLCL